MGAVLKVDATNFELTVLHSFSGPDGAYPLGRVALDSAGNVYGTTGQSPYSGSDGSPGTVFKLDASNGYQLTTLHTFGNGIPVSGLTPDSQGNLYGSTSTGIIFKLDSSNDYAVSLLTVLAPLQIPPSDITPDGSGNLYGVIDNYNANTGSVFKLIASSNYSLSTVATFGSSVGCPASGLVIGPDGQLYGTAFGPRSAQFGLVYRLDPGTGVVTVLHAFDDGPGGQNPGGLLLDAAGNVFGTTSDSCASSGCNVSAGTVFRLDSANTYALTTLHTFEWTDGSNPEGAIVFDALGSVYGSTASGGSSNRGTVYTLDALNGYALTTLATFRQHSGTFPFGGLVSDQGHSLYGTTVQEGVTQSGTVFKLDAGNEFAFSVLHSFGTDGANPRAPLIIDSEGNLYGPVSSNGVFELDASEGYSLSLLHIFSGWDGSVPWGSVARDIAGNLYGTTLFGGTGGLGTVFRLDASAPHALTTLYSFQGEDGGYPYGSLLIDEAGNVYGTTSGEDGSTNGTVFMLTASAGYGLTLLHTFTGPDGGDLHGGLVMDSQGNLFGTTTSGGQYNSGTVFELDASQGYALRTIHDFASAPLEGGGPDSTLVEDSNGNLYGTTRYGGSVSGGTLFKLERATNWSLKLLHDFTGLDGAGPTGGLVLDPAGYIYGTTYSGGTGGAGVAYRVGVSSFLILAPSVAPVDGTTSLSATLVSGGAPVSGEAISLAVNGVTVGIAVTDSSGVATLPVSIAGVSPGSYRDGIVATFAGDGSLPQAVAAADLTVVCPPVPAVASGTATINVGQSAPLVGSGGVACLWSPSTGLDDANSCTPNAHPTSTTRYVLVVTDGNGCRSTNNPTVTVTVTTAVCTLVSSLDPAVFGQAITFTATVDSGGGVPTGVVTFRDSDSMLGTSTLDAKGTAQLTISSLGTGIHALTAFYTGDSAHAPSMSLALRQVVTSPNACGQTAPAIPYTAGQTPWATAFGDFNEDGKQDLAVLNANSGDVSILAGNGEGTLQPAISIPVGYSPAGLAVADMDGDGHLDLVVTQLGVNVVGVLRGDGYGGFGSPTQYSVGNGPRALVVGDLNGDGLLDVVTSNENDQNVTVLLGQADGTLLFHGSFPTGQYASRLALGDFNSDGMPDLTVALESGGVDVLIGNGDGSFQPAINYSAGTNPYDVAVGDLNGDGRDDMIVANLNSGDVSVFIGKGDGSFQAPVAYAAQLATTAVILADVNGDGILDAVTVNRDPSSSMSVLIGNGDGTFQAAVNSAVGIWPFRVAAGDLNGDGRVDFAVANVVSSNVSIILGSCLATHLAVTAPTVATAGIPISITVSALDPKNHVAPGYNGTVHFVSTDSVPVLPPNYTFTAADAGVHTFSVTFNTPYSQTVTATDTVNASITGSSGPVAVSAVASAFVSGGGTVCVGRTAMIQAALGGTAPWTLIWSDGVTQSGIVTSPATRSVAPGGTTTYTVRAVSDANGPGTSTGSATVTVNPLPSALITPPGPVSIPFGGSARLTANTGASWLWSTGETTRAITVSTSGSYSVTVTSSLGCSAVAVPVAVIVALACSPTPNEFPVPTAGSHPQSIAAGPDGALWFTEFETGRIGRITTAGAIAEFTVPTVGSNPFAITAGSDGALWFTEVGKIGRISTGGVITEFPVPSGGGVLYGITAGPDRALWFTESSGNKIGRITTGGVITEFNVPTSGAYPYGIVAGLDSALWFTEEFGEKIGRITTGGVITEFTDPTADGHPVGITAGPDGALWFSYGATDKIGRITTGGVITEFTLSAGDNNLDGITAGPDGALWFTESSTGANKIGRITTAGLITEYSIPTSGSNSFGITAGPDGALWFAEQSTNQIGRICTTATPLASAAVSGGGTVCAGQTAMVQAALTGSAPWSLTWSDGLAQTDLSSSPVIRNVTPSLTTTYTVTAISDASGPGTPSGSATVTVNPAPAATVTPAGPITLPFGGSATLTASAGTSWLWSTGETTQAITVSTSGSYTVTLTNGFGCSATSASVVVTVSTSSADVQVTLATSAASAAIDQDVTLTVTAANAGSSDASGVAVTDLLPVGLSLVSATPSTGTYSSSNGVWSIGALPNGGSATLQIIATVTHTGSIADTASKTAQNEPDPDSANDSATVLITGQPTADVRVTKTVDNPSPLVGRNVTFTLTTSNAGPSDASAVQVTDLLPSGLQFVSATPSAPTTYDSSTGFWAVGGLPNGTSATLQIVATVSQPGAITNNATKTAQVEFDPNTSNDSAAASLNAQPVADLQIQNVASNPTPALGQNVVLTVTATNAGPNDATGVHVTDLLPAGLAFVSALPPGSTTYNSATGVWNIGALSSSSSLALQITAKVIAIGSIVDTASKSAEAETDPNPANDFASVTLNGQPSADVQLAQSASSPLPAVGQSVQFNVTVTNLGPSSASGVQVTDMLPGSLTFVSAMPSQGTYNSGTGLWDTGSLAASGSATLQLVAVVGQTGSITNTATKSAETESDPNPSNDSAAVTITGQSSADIGMTMTSNKPNPAVGTNVTFTIKASNGGPDNATGVKVTDLLPAGLSFVSATPTQGTYSSGTGLWSVGAVNNAATATLTLVAKVTAAGTIINTATKTAENEVDLNPVNDAASVSLNKAVTTTTLVSSVNPSTFGQSVTFTATVAAASGTPTGTVTFKRGAAVLGTATLSGGVATFTTSALPVGTGSFTAAYGGDVNFAPSTSAAVSQKVTKAATATALVASPATSATYGQPVTFTATVTSSGGVPAGTVTFKNGGASLGTVALVNGVASLTTTTLPGGVRSITAVYGGDPSFGTSTSPVLSFTINPAATSTALSTSQNPSVYKQPVTLVATVTSPGLNPTGNVKFMNGASTLATVALSGGTASLTTTTLTVGPHSITAVYVGTANFATSTSTAINQVVNPAPTLTALTTAPNPSTVGQQVTLTAAVSSAYATPTGTVTFKDGATTLGTKTLASGVASLNITTLSSGTHAITAIYNGVANFSGSTSPPVSQAVN